MTVLYTKVRRSCSRPRAQELCGSQDGCLLHNSHGLCGRKATVPVKVNLLVPLMESRETMLVEEIRHEATCFGTIVPGYEVCGVSLNLLHLVDVLLEVGVPDEGCVVQEWTDKNQAAFCLRALGKHLRFQ